MSFKNICFEIKNFWCWIFGEFKRLEKLSITLDDQIARC